MIIDELKPTIALNLQLFAEDGEVGADTGADTSEVASVDADTDTSDADIDENFFDEEDFANEEQEQEEKTEEEPKEQQPEDTTPKVDKFKVKYNKEEKELTLDEMTAYAQKGMNYDKIYNEYDKFKSVLDGYAKKENMSVGDYVDKLIELNKTRSYNDRVEQLLDDGVPEEYAKKLVDAELEKEKITEENNRKALQNEQYVKQQQQAQEFVNKYPDVAREWGKQIPQDAQQLLNDGYSLEDAYIITENKKLKAEIENLKHEQKVKKKSVGSMKSDGKADDMDDFLKGFYSE